MSKAKYDKYSKYIIEIDFSNFDSSTIINMEFAFSGCSSLISLDLSNWNTKFVRDMHSMFLEYIKLTSLN